VSEPRAAASTRERLLEAAGHVFAEHGYHATTVREIVKRSGANIAAVNYHFGGKLGLCGRSSELDYKAWRSQICRTGTFES
jgi:AcrR family transcriptional regulator